MLVKLQTDRWVPNLCCFICFVVFLLNSLASLCSFLYVFRVMFVCSRSVCCSDDNWCFLVYGLLCLLSQAAR